MRRMEDLEVWDKYTADEPPRNGKWQYIYTHCLQSYGCSQLISTTLRRPSTCYFHAVLCIEICNAAPIQINHKKIILAQRYLSKAPVLTRRSKCIFADSANMNLDSPIEFRLTVPQFQNKPPFTLRPTIKVKGASGVQTYEYHSSTNRRAISMRWCNGVNQSSVRYDMDVLPVACVQPGRHSSFCVRQASIQICNP
jgi:hypothetical protein